MSDDGFPVPEVDSVNRPFWEGANEGRLMLQRCEDCGLAIFYPRVACPDCFSHDLSWFEAEGTGEVYTYGVVHRPNRPDVFGDEVPFVVVVVELTEGPRLLSNLEGCAPDDVRIGQSVRAFFDEVADGVSLPKFEPAEER